MMAQMHRRDVALRVLTCGLLLIFCAAVRAEQQGTNELVAATKSADARVRLKAIHELGASGDAAAVPALVKLLQANSPVERGYAAKALGMIGAPAKSAAKNLIDLLGDPDAGVRRQAIAALAAIRPGPKVSVPIFVKLMADSDPGVRIRVMHAVADTKGAAVPALVEALKNEAAAYWACVILRDIGPDAKAAVPALVEMLNDPRPEIRREAVLALAAIGSTDSIEKLVPLLKDETSRTPATFALGALGQIPPDAESIVRANVKGDDKMLGTVSLWALARVHPQDMKLKREAITQLVARLSDEDPFVRGAAARALSDLPPSPEIAIPIFEKALADADETTTSYMLDALAGMGPKAVPRLIGALKYKSMRPQVAYILGQIGPPAAPATEALAKLVNDEDHNVNIEAAHALAKIGPGAKAAVPALIVALEGTEGKPTHAAAYALGMIGPNAASAEPALLEVINRHDDSRSLIGAWALVRIRGPSADTAAKVMSELLIGLESPVPESRKAAAETLGSLGVHAKSALPQLKRATQDDDKDVRAAATKALESIHG
jgi:HEAT repeat protein